MKMRAKIGIFLEETQKKPKKSLPFLRKCLTCAQKPNKNVILNLRFIIFAAFLLAAAPSATSQQLKEQRGNASYYADRFHGRLMSNGQPYHRDSMTCAHLRYPLGTWLRVRNLTNGKEVIVQVTDRGPYSRKFVIDLSRAAARELDIIQYGFRQVEITPFVEGKIPYRFDPPTERPELDLGYSADDVFDPPVWMEDSIYRARHRLSRTQVVALDEDSLREAVKQDSTLHEAVKRTAKGKREK